MKHLLFGIFLTVILCSCDSGFDPMTVTMKDGKTITITSTQKYYSEEKGFIHGVSFSFPRPYNYSEIEDLDYHENTEYMVTGANQFYIGAWEIARFSNWIRAYGLDPDKSYYIATKVYTKYISSPPKGLRIVPKLGINCMGYCPDVEPQTFWAINNSENQVSILTTGVRYVGYDSDGDKIDKEIPSLIDKNHYCPVKVD